MFSVRYSARVLGAALALEVVAVAPRASADKRQCADAYTQTQILRKAGKLRAAEKSTFECTQAACPDFIKSACSKWGSEIQAATPTIVVSAKDAQGNDLTDVSVTFDGQRLVNRLTGLAIAVDPGQHVLRFEHAGDKPVDQKILISEGEKARVVKVTFGSKPPGAVQGAAPVGGETASTGSGTRALAYVLAGVGAVGLGGFAYFGLTGKSEENSVRASNCAPNCSSSQIDPIKTKYVLADVSLGVGVVSLGLATYFFFASMHKTSSKSENAQRLRFDVAATPKGSFATVSGSF